MHCMYFVKLNLINISGEITFVLLISGESPTGLPNHIDRHWTGGGVPDGWSLSL